MEEIRVTRSMTYADLVKKKCKNKIPKKKLSLSSTSSTSDLDSEPENNLSINISEKPRINYENNKDVFDEYDSDNYNSDSDVDYIPNFLEESDTDVDSNNKDNSDTDTDTESISSQEVDDIKSNTDTQSDIRSKRILRIDSNKEREYGHSNKKDLIYFNKLSPEEKTIIIEMEENIKKINQNRKPLRFKILESKLHIDIKASTIAKLEALNTLDDSSNEYNKIKTYIDGLIKIPFGNYIELPINKNNTEIEIKDFLVNSKNILENAVIGHQEAQCHILQLISQWISNPDSKCNSLAIYGDMGIGKTTLIKHGLSKVLGRPYEFISLGGSNDSSFLDGHSYTYEGSQWGKIIQILQEKKCMNPIIYFDELDKISETPKGEEIVNLLIHLTDDSQNSHFQDKYFTGIDIDLSRVLFVFSFNQTEKINPILRDRIHTIKLEGFNLKEKVTIAEQYLIKSILIQFKIPNTEIIFSEDNIEYIIKNYTKENGVRDLRKKLHTIISRINLIKLSLSSKDLDLPFDSHKIDITKQIILNTELIDCLLKNNQLNNQENISKLMMYM